LGRQFHETHPYRGIPSAGGSGICRGDCGDKVKPVKDHACVGQGKERKKKQGYPVV
jgi:hypothetical protein